MSLHKLTPSEPADIRCDGKIGVDKFGRDLHCNYPLICVENYGRICNNSKCDKKGLQEAP